MSDLEQLAECYKALGDKTRLYILSLLKEEELCICELVEVLHITQPAVSQHMRKLKNAKIVKVRRKGQWLIYSLTPSAYPFLDACLKVLPNVTEEINKLKRKGLKATCE